MANKHIQPATRASLQPTVEQTFQIEGGGLLHFEGVLHRTSEWQRQGEFTKACEERYRAVQALMELLPEEEIALDWNHGNSRAALEVVRLSAVDHFLIGDLELSTALLELLLELDPEDRLEASELLAYEYVELGEWELFEEILPDVASDVSRLILTLWASFMRQQPWPSSAYDELRKRYAPYFAELVAEEHPADAAYLQQIESERPTQAAKARELWLKTEPFWVRHPDFIEVLRQTKESKAKA